MRRQLRRIGGRSMARRPGGDGDAPLTLSPRVLRIGGWVAAIFLIAGIAVVVGLFGGDADSGPLGASPSASGSVPGGTALVFGTSIDEATGQVAEGAGTDRFVAGDTFAYSVALSGTSPDPVFVEVRRTGGGVVEVVQTPLEGRQPLERPLALAFDVAADRLFEVFGPGEYLMLIYADPALDPIAEGSFILVGAPAASPSASASVVP